MKKEKQKKVKKIKPPVDPKKVYLSRLIKPVMFFAFALILEFISFCTLSISSNFVKFSLFPEYVWFDIGVFLVFTAILFLTAFAKKLWVQNTFFYIFISIQVALNVLNSIILKSSGSIFDFQQIMLLGEGVAAFNYHFIDILAVFLNVIALGVIITSQILLDKFVKKSFQSEISIKRLFAASLTAICAFSGIVSYSTETTNLTYIDSKYYWDSLSFKLNSLQKFGTYGFFTKDFYNTFLKSNELESKAEVLQNIKDAEVSANPSATLYDDNLIMIMLESFDWFAIDPYNTPTLWKLYNEGVSCTNYVSNNKTNVSEALSLLGYMPDVPLLSFKNSNLLSTKYSLPNSFKEQGYNVSYFHSFQKTFYERNVNNKNLGFDHLYFVEDAEKINSQVKDRGFNQWNREVDFFECFKNKIAPTDGSKFMSFYLTVATHGAYDYDLKYFDKYFDIYDNNLKNTNFLSWFETQGYKYPSDTASQKQLRQYKAAAIDTDRMIQKLLEHLETEVNGQKLIDNTTLVLFSDHNVYYHDTTYKVKNTDRSDYSNTTHYTVPLIFYSKKLPAQKIDYFTNTQDIYPTICSLFGIKHNTYMSTGYSVFDTEHDHIYYSQLTGYYSKQFYSLNMFDTIDISGGATKQDTDHFFTETEKLYQKQQILTRIYKSKLKR